jgi:hypothetical protein
MELRGSCPLFQGIYGLAAFGGKLDERGLATARLVNVNSVALMTAWTAISYLACNPENVLIRFQPAFERGFVWIEQPSVRGLVSCGDLRPTTAYLWKVEALDDLVLPTAGQILP